MSLSEDNIKKIAHLAKLNLSAEDLSHYAAQLSTILNFVEQMSEAKTDHISPVCHAHDASQPMRPDAVTESNQREAFQSIAPAVEGGLYLVPQVIEG